VPEEPDRVETGVLGRHVRRRRLMFLAGAALVVVAAVMVTLVLVDRHKASSRNAAAEDATTATPVTSPYDLHEAPAGTGPGDVKSASLVSISLVTEDGKSDYYGLSADTAAAKALIEAVSGAGEVDAATIATTTTGSAAGQSSAIATLTFLFPDRSTLAFDLYVAQRVIARGGHYWQVAGDLPGLIDAAVSSSQQ
jgi:hypothetical protein